MLKKTIISAAFGAAVIMAASTGSNAMPGGAIGLGSLQTETGQSDVIQVGHKFKKKFKHFRFHHGHYPRYRSCYWLKNKAIYTGRDYWWHRYEDCKYRYYY